MQVIWTASALRGIALIQTYLINYNPAAAARLTDALLEAANTLSLFPYKGRPVPRTRMREIVSVRPYVLRYRIADETVIVIRVRHASRRPTRP